MIIDRDIKRLQKENLKMKQFAERENLKKRLQQENFALKHRKGIRVLKGIGRSFSKVQKIAKKIEKRKGRSKRSSILEPTQDWGI